MKQKKLDFMNVKGRKLTREEMRNVMAGCGGSGGEPCMLAIRDSDGNWVGWWGCFTPGQAQFYYGGWTFPDGNHASGYCCASCGTDGFSSAPGDRC